MPHMSYTIPGTNVTTRLNTEQVNSQRTLCVFIIKGNTMDTADRTESNEKKQEEKETQEFINRVTDKVMVMWRQDLAIERERKRVKRR